MLGFMGLVQEALRLGWVSNLSVFAVGNRTGGCPKRVNREERFSAIVSVFKKGVNV